MWSESMGKNSLELQVAIKHDISQFFFSKWITSINWSSIKKHFSNKLIDELVYWLLVDYSKTTDWLMGGRRSWIYSFFSVLDPPPSAQEINKYTLIKNREEKKERWAVRVRVRLQTWCWEWRPPATRIRRPAATTVLRGGGGFRPWRSRGGVVCPSSCSLQW
jgi:hypothetical protein